MSKVSGIIESIERLLGDLKGALGEGHPPTKRRHENVPIKTSGLAAEINNLVKEGFFREPRNLSDIQRKLRLDGINKPTSTLTKPLLKLLKAKIIKREEAPNGKGPFTYLQRGE